MADEDNDRSLLARLNALKPTTVGLSKALDHSPEPEEEADDGDDIARRFLGLRAKGPDTTGSNTRENEPTEMDDVENIDDMLKEFRAKQKISLASDDDKRIKILLAQAKASLDETEVNEDKDTAQNDTEAKEDGLKQAEDDSQSVDEDAEADDILAQILDEVNLEDASGEDGNATAHSDDPAANEPPVSSFEDFALPNTPSKEPQSLTKPSSDELTLPSAPTSVPAKPKPKTSLRKYNDAEIETWCEICQANAEVRCLGCDGDLYCMRCWKEGHTGPDVGYEERQHRCVQYSRPGRPEAAAA